VTLTEFLLARITEDEAAAQDCVDSGAWSAFRHEEGLEWWVTSANFGHVVTTGYVGNKDSRPNAEHIARHDPARVLAEAAAKRAIVDEFVKRRDAPPESMDVAPEVAKISALKFACRALAAVYNDHPDYRQEWKP
jgi:hypothetical protein